MLGKAWRITAGQPDHQIRLCVVLSEELLHILDRKPLDRTHRTAVVMGIGISVVNIAKQTLLAQLFVIAFPKRGFEKIQRIVADALEVVGTKTGVEKQILDDGIVNGKRFLMRGP